MPLIVNADDFGKDHETNLAICEAFEKGLIGRTTLMANMEAAGEAMEMAFRKGFADRVGVHLNLTQGRPLTKAIASDRIMCDENGLFTADFHRNTLKRFLLPAATRRLITAELDAQLSRFLELGGSLRHVDSHHHVHTDMSVLMAFWPLAKRYGINGIRLGRNMYHGGNKLMRLYKLLLNKRLNRINEVKGDLFGSVLDFENYGFSDELINNNNIEIMVHPMYVDGVLFDTDYPMSQMPSRMGGNV